MIVFGIRCNFFIVLLIRLKTCRSSIFFFYYYKAKCAPPKNRVHLRGFVHPSAPNRHWARNLLDANNTKFSQISTNLTDSWSESM